MTRIRLAAFSVLALCVGSATAAEMVGVDGSKVQYTNPAAVRINGKDMNFVLTGTALRKKLVFNVYAIGSYVQEGVKVKSADELAAADCPKRLWLVMERDLEGKEMADAFRNAIRLNHPEPAFNDEVNKLSAFMQTLSVKQGDHVWLTHVPAVGLHCQVMNKADLTIQNPKFSRAVWDIYLGKNNLGDGIKKGLLSRQ
jgi:hypothetical protein